MAEPGLVRGLGGRLAFAAAAGAVAAYVGHRITARRDSALLKRVRKGVFIEKSLFDDPATALRLAGIEWVLLETAIQKAGKDVWISRDRAKLEALEAVINPPGSAYRIEIWGWGWPIPAGAVDFAAHVGDVLQSDILAGYCLDIEAKSWSTKTQPPATMELTCAALINAIRARSSKSLLLSSHGRADYAPLPWVALRALDGALPQVYDSSNKYGDGFAARCIESYTKMGYRDVYPTLGAATSSVQRMGEQLRTLPPVAAVSWWTWTSIGRNPERQAVIRDFGATSEEIARVSRRAGGGS